MVGVYTILGITERGWGSTQTLGLSAASAVALRRLPPPPGADRQPADAAAACSARATSPARTSIQALLVAGMFGMFFLGALYLQRVLGYDALEVGLAFLPTTVVMGTLSLGFSEKLIMRFGPRTTLIPGVAMVGVGLLLFARTPVDGNYLTDLLPPMLLIGIGVGTAFPSMMTLAMSGTTPGGVRARLGPRQHQHAGRRRDRPRGAGDALASERTRPRRPAAPPPLGADLRLSPRLPDRCRRWSPSRWSIAVFVLRAAPTGGDAGRGAGRRRGSAAGAGSSPEAAYSAARRQPTSTDRGRQGRGLAELTSRTLDPRCPADRAASPKCPRASAPGWAGSPVASGWSGRWSGSSGPSCPAPPRGRRAGCSVIAALVLAYGLGSVTGLIPWQRASMNALAIGMALTIPVVGLAIYLTGGSISYIEPLLVCSLLYAAFFFPPRWAWPLSIELILVAGAPLLYDDRAVENAYVPRYPALVAGFLAVDLGDGRAQEPAASRPRCASATIANRDPLTGVANRRVFDATLRRELAAARLARPAPRATREPLALLIVDLDDFKAINDDHGHQIGDAVLRQTAERARGDLRSTDLLARIGGDEFAVIAPGAHGDGAERMAEAIRTAVALDDPSSRVPSPSASVGLAALPRGRQRLREADARRRPAAAPPQGQRQPLLRTRTRHAAADLSTARLISLSRPRRAQLAAACARLSLLAVARPSRPSACRALTKIARGTVVANIRAGPMQRVPKASKFVATFGSRAAAAKSIFSPAFSDRPVA